MKSSSIVLYAAVLMAAVLSQGCASPGSRVGWWRANLGNLSWEEVKTVAHTPKEICAQVWRHVDFKKDQGDEWPSGIDVWQRGYGDCEDFARAVVDLCAEKGIRAEILVFQPEKSQIAHAVAVGHWQGELWVSNNGRFATAENMGKIEDIVRFDVGWFNQKLIVTPIAMLTPPTPTIAASNCAQ
jgi:predicted transglutaminase-like cysteine proteinase